MDLQRLREQTAAEHASTEEAVPLMSPSLTRDAYVASLRRFHRVVSAWDRWADAHAPADLLSLLQGRRRATLLEQDLRDLGVPASADPTPVPSMEHTAVSGNLRSVFLGRMYVMEGSTLGGQYLARHAEQALGLRNGEGTAYFRGYGQDTSARWREFRTVLQSLQEAEADTVLCSAKEMFSIFREAMQCSIPDVYSGHSPGASPG